MIIILICVILASSAYIGYRYYAYTYRYGNEIETTLTETNTDPIISEDKLLNNLSKYEIFSYYNHKKINKNSYVIPGLKATKTMESDRSETFSMCTSMTPQGICITDKYLFISSYCHTHKHNSVLYMMDRKTHAFIKEIILPGKPHVGNIAYDPDFDRIWVACTGTNFLTGSKTAYLNCVSVSALEEYDTSEGPKTIKYDEKYMIAGFKNASFISYYKGNLFVGNYYTGEWKDSYVVRFPITIDGGLETKVVFTETGFKDVAYGREKAIIGEKCQGVYFDDGYLLLMQSSGTQKSEVLSFVNSEYQQDVEEMICLENVRKGYQLEQRRLKEKEESLQQLEEQMEEPQKELDSKLEEAESIENKIQSINEDIKELEDKEKIEEKREEKKTYKEQLDSLKEEINILEEQLNPIKEEYEKEKELYEHSLEDAIEFDEKAYQERTKQTKDYSLENDKAVKTFVFPPRLEQAMISPNGNFKTYLLFESGAYAYSAQAGVEIVDRVIILE